MEPSNVKQKRHPNPNSVNENSFEDRKSGPQQAAEVNNPHPKKKSSPEDNSRSVDSAERSEVGQLHEVEEEVMYSDGGHRAAVVSGLHPKLQQAPTISSASIFSLYFSLQTGLLVLASLWCTIETPYFLMEKGKIYSEKRSALFRKEDNKEDTVLVFMGGHSDDIKLSVSLNYLLCTRDNVH